MEKNFNSIDSVFKSELKDYKVSVPESVWDDIELELIKQRKGKVLSFYKIAAAIAAFVMLGSTFLYFFGNNENIVSEPILAQSDMPKYDKIEKKAEVKVLDVIDEKEINIKNNVTDKLLAKNEILDPKTQEVASNTKFDSLKQNIEKLLSFPIKINVEHSAPVFLAVNTKKSEPIINKFFDINSTKYSYSAIIEEDNNSKKNKWLVGVEYTPLYSYRHLSQSSNTAQTNNYNQLENPIMSFTGGLNLQFTPKDRLTIQAGVYYLTMGQSLDNMSVYSNQAYKLVSEKFRDRYINSYEIDNSVGLISFNTQYAIVDESASRVINNSNTKDLINVKDPAFQNLEAEIQQNFQYIEIPFLLKYKLIDKQADFNIIGGLGANFLIGNDVYLIYGGKKEIVGETNNVSNVNYSTTLGFGIEYPIFNRINIRLEPSVKYYLNAINPGSAAESHPYSFGIYTGICYSF